MKKISLVMIISALFLSLTACSGSNKTQDSREADEPREKEYITEDEISGMFSNPEDYKGKYVELIGRIFTPPEKNEDTVALQIWGNPKESSDSFIVHYKNPTEDFSSDEYVKVDGRIDGSFEGENAFGASLSMPLIQADSVEKMSYIDAMAPTKQSAEPQNAIAEQNGISLRIDKVEFADEETRIYLTESNNSSDKFSFAIYGIKVIQNGQQIEQDTTSDSSYYGNYQKLSDDILPGASASGVIVFPPLSTDEFQLYAEGYSDNWELNFSPFTINLKFSSGN